MSYFFFLYGSPSSSLCTVFDSISSNIDEVLSINPSASDFVFGDFNVISNDLIQKVNFPTRIPDCDSHSPTLLDLFVSSDDSICFTMAFPQLGNLIMLLSQSPLAFHEIHNGMSHFIA